MRNFLFRKIKSSREDRSNPLFFSLASQTRIPYLWDAVSTKERALDVGCGIGFFSNIMIQKFSRVTAIDPDKKSIEKAKILYPAANIEFIQASAEQIPLPADSFDFLLCSEVLEHVDDLKKTLQEIKRVGKADSRFFITVPSADGIFKNFFLAIGHRDANLYEQHKRPPFTKKNITKLLLDNNFQIEKIYYSKIFLAEIFMRLTKLLHNLKKGESIGGQSDILMPPKIYRRIFPLMLFLAKLEDFILHNVLRGHMLIISGRIKK